MNYYYHYHCTVVYDGYGRARTQVLHLIWISGLNWVERMTCPNSRSHRQGLFMSSACSLSAWADRHHRHGIHHFVWSLCVSF